MSSIHTRPMVAIMNRAGSARWHGSLATTRRGQLARICLAVLLVAVAMPGRAAWAHAFLNHASPAVGSELSSAPSSLELTYTEAVEPLFSTVEVADASGQRVDEGKPTPQDGGRVLVVKLKTLAAGVYTVTWHVTSVDTHKTEGHFNFTIKP